MALDLADELRRWRQTRVTVPGLPLPITTRHRIAVADHEVLVVRRRLPRVSVRSRPRTVDAGQ